MAGRSEIRKKGACHESCDVFICMYGKKRGKPCDFSQCQDWQSMPEPYQRVLEDKPVQTLSQDKAGVPDHA